jgi:hypothetical protein
MRGFYSGTMSGSNGWKVPIRGFELLEVWLSGETYLILYGPEAERVQFRFGSEAELLGSEGSIVRLNGGGAWETLAPLFRLRHRKIAEGEVSAQGQVTLRFDGGSSLLVRPDEQYESWELTGPGDLILVCPPGGGDPRIAGGLPSPG